MKKREMKEKNLRRGTGKENLNCAKCGNGSDFVIMANADVECSHCGDVKGNISHE